jgi:hypothetical protein
MSVAVINRIELDVAPETLAADVEREFGPVFLSLAGFERFFFVRTGDREATVVIVWDTAEHATAGAEVIGPTIFNAYIAPHADRQSRVVGPVLASAGR